MKTTNNTIAALLAALLFAAHIDVDADLRVSMSRVQTDTAVVSALEIELQLHVGIQGNQRIWTKSIRN